MDATSSRFDHALAATQTDEQGAWAASILPDDVRALWMVVTSTDSPGAGREFEVTASELAQLRAGEHVVHLRAAATASGPAGAPGVRQPGMPPSRAGVVIAVRDPAGQPVVGAKVGWLATGMGPDGVERTAQTDDSGRCTPCEISARSFLVRAKGFAEHVGSLPRQFGPAGAPDVQLTPAAPVTVRVVDSTDAPLAVVTITAQVKSTHKLVAKAGQSGPDGVLQWDRLPTGDIAWSAIRSGKNLAVVDATSGQLGELIVRTRPAAVLHLTGSVTDADTGAPVSEFTVTALPTSKPPPQNENPGAGPTFAADRFDIYLEQAVKVGRLVGARILVTGKVYAIDDQTMMTAKVIGVETSRVEAILVKESGRADLAARPPTWRSRFRRDSPRQRPT
ncbi:MAG: carboxypeptidase regulatory-like domain-containing protein [Phycisphaerales bacterium]|nr:carboxypeptidase regulatory-like domain-containing protein [Phycisphaerales bacterium]